MHYRRLGKTNFEVSEVGFGAWGIGGNQWLGGSDRGSLAALRRAIDAGVNFFDTAFAYGEGHSEKLVGRTVKETGREIYIATKVPPKNRIWPARAGIGIEDVFPYDYIVDTTEMSLRNLEVETIDLQQLHVWNPEWIGRDEWRRAFEHLKTSGKVRAIGVSINDHQPDSAIELIETGLIDTVQVIYNIFDQTPEKNLFPAAIQHDIGVIARVPLDEGSLGGRIHEHTVFDKGDFREGYFRGDRKKEVVEHVNALIADTGVERDQLAGLALRFCLSHRAVSTVIPGMRSISSVDANCAISGQGPLPDQMLAILKQHAWDRNYYL